MQTIGGGSVRYVGVQLLPCPDEPDRVGQVVGPARLELLWRGRVVERIALEAGDELLVADGVDVAPGAELVVREPWRRALRAAIPDGVEATVRWSEPLLDTVDAVTGMPGIAFAADRAVTIDLLVDGAPVATATMRHASPIVRAGAVVRRGDRLAWIWWAREPRELHAGIETLRAILDARRLDRTPSAVVAPHDAIVIDIGRRWIVLRTSDERVLHLRIPPHAHVTVGVNDIVLAGHPLTYGERNHRALLHAWGEQRLGEHIIDELSRLSGGQVPRAYWALALRAMLHGGQLRGIGALARARRTRSHRRDGAGATGPTR